MDQHFFEGAFFQDMIHSGCNAYLTLHVAQALLRGGAIRGSFDCVRAGGRDRIADRPSGRRRFPTRAPVAAAWATAITSGRRPSGS